MFIVMLLLAIWYVHSSVSAWFRSTLSGIRIFFYSFSLAIFTSFYYNNSTTNPMNHFKNWLDAPTNQFKSIVPLCGSHCTTTVESESTDLPHISYQYQTNINDTGQIKDAVNFRFWNLSKGMTKKNYASCLMSVFISFLYLSQMIDNSASLNCFEHMENKFKAQTMGIRYNQAMDWSNVQ